MRAAYDSFDQETKEMIEGLVCEHSQMYSRRLLGFTDFSAEEQARFQPVRQSLVRTHPSTGRKSVYLSSHAGDILGWPRPEALSRCCEILPNSRRNASSSIATNGGNTIS